jgi:hypothetical protein
MVSSGYAYNAERLGGLESSEYSHVDHTHHSLDAADGSPSQAVYVDDDGNVGVGTISPSGLLDVAGDVNTSSTYKVRGETVLAADENHNTLVGESAGMGLTTGEMNTAVGSHAGYSLMYGYGNTFVGLSAGLAVSESDANTFVGHKAGAFNHGERNTFVGALTGGSDVSAGSDNVFIGYSAGDLLPNVDDALVIGNIANPHLIQGDFAEGIVQLNDILSLRPRSGPPPDPEKGWMYMDDNTDKLMVYDGTSWQACW